MKWYKFSWALDIFAQPPVLTKMNVLTTIKDGDVILKVSGNFRPSKTVSINSFGGQTYIHLRSPTDVGWKTFTMTIREWGSPTQTLNGDELSKIEDTFMIQVRIFVLNICLFYFNDYKQSSYCIGKWSTMYFADPSPLHGIFMYPRNVIYVMNISEGKI